MPSQLGLAKLNAISRNDIALMMKTRLLRTLLAMVISGGTVAALGGMAGCSASDKAAADQRVYFGVLGDSDSHSFHDMVFLDGPALRGAEFRPITFQWTEIIARLRPQQINMGEWGKWGMSGRLAAVLSHFGFEDRAPRKEDYQFNFATSGAKCSNLTEGMSRQTQRLLYHMDKNPAAWAHGIITIRIGVNSIGTQEALAGFAQSGLSASALKEVDSCTNYVHTAVDLIRANHPTTRIVLIGILNNADFIPWINDWTTPTQLKNINDVMDAYDNGMKKIAADDSNILFWDDRAWFKKYWGGRDDNGNPNYHGLFLSGPQEITYTQGNSPVNAILGDGHAGVAWNGIWARDLLQALNQNFDYAFIPIDINDIAKLIDADRRFGIAGPVTR
ncbi:MAG: hypothetical protein JWM78_3304 [Verrucomicrobiaceae bacterium]|nr:hypothetical protein [Verrucomicrobiaceae bacterium]